MKPRALEQPTAMADASSWLESLPFLEPLANSLECGMMIIDGARRIVLASDPMASMFGLDASQLRDMTTEAFVEYVAGLVDDPPQLLRERRILADAGIVCEEFELARPSRSVIRWVARRITSPRPAQVVVCTDITAEVDLTAAYERLAVTDRLTNLSNRRGAEAVIRREIVRVKRFAAPLSFVLFDIDHFKRINDTLGHGSGDQVLQAVGRTLSASLRETDLAARWGGEEFLLVLPNTTYESAILCAERVRKVVASLPLPVGAVVTISGGVAQLKPGEEIADVVARADEQLYKAKAGGRNRIC